MHYNFISAWNLNHKPAKQSAGLLFKPTCYRLLILNIYSECRKRTQRPTDCFTASRVRMHPSIPYIWRYLLTVSEARG